MHDLRRQGRADRSGSIVSDAMLLERFVACRDESAFELLVWRHGAMVLALCQRLLGDAHAAEDVFQATFLTLAQKAEAIQKSGSLASWLYKVSYRLALRARELAALRDRREQKVPDPVLYGFASGAGADSDWEDVRPILDEEIRRLPEKYREVFVLCCLEEKNQEEAAADLGIPVGTVYSRLSRARSQLRGRLQKRGLAMRALPAVPLLATRDLSGQLVHAAAAQSVALVRGSLKPEMLSPALAALLAPAAAASSLWTYAAAILLFFLVGGTGYWAWEKALRAASTPPPAHQNPPPCTLPKNCGAP